MLGIELGDVVGQVLGIEPGPEPAHVALVLRDRVRRPAVGLELDEEAGEGVGEAHGLELVWVATSTTVAMDARWGSPVKSPLERPPIANERFARDRFDTVGKAIPAGSRGLRNTRVPASDCPTDLGRACEDRDYGPHRHRSRSDCISAKSSHR